VALCAEGIGRDDLGIEILRTAEGLIRRVSAAQSRAVRNLSEKIKSSFQAYRELLRKYAQNIEVVDPQLKNNPDMVTVLQEIETSWEKGKEYLLDPKTCNRTIHFSSVVEGTMEKNNEFKEAIESMDAQIFITIPSLLILKSLEDDDRGICKSFYPDMFNGDKMVGQTFLALKRSYQQGCDSSDDYAYYNQIEK